MDRPLAIFARRIRETFETNPAHARAFYLALRAEGRRQLVRAQRHRIADVKAGLRVIDEAYRAVKS